jgi:hypothetical protein
VRGTECIEESLGMDQALRVGLSRFVLVCSLMCAHELKGELSGPANQKGDFSRQW